MAPIVCENTIRVGVNGTFLGKTWANVFHFMQAGVPTDAESAAERWATGYSILLGQTSVSTGANSISYIDLDTLSGDSGTVVPAGWPNAGTASGNTLSPNVAVLLKWGASGTRSQRDGRTYMMGIPESQVDDNGSLNGTAVTNWNDALDDAMANWAANDIIPVICSKTPGGGYEPRTITSWLVDAQVATQRRRLRR